MSADSTSRRECLLWTVVLFSFTALGGVALQVRGPLLATFQREFGVSESMLGLVTPIAAVSFVTVVLAFGLAAGRINSRRWLLIGTGGSSVALFLMGAAPTFLFLLGMMGVRSVTRGMVKALDRPLLSHLYPMGRGRIYTLYAMVWAMGATLGPLLVTAVLLIGTWRDTYVVIAVLMIPIFASIWLLDVPNESNNERPFAVSELPELVSRSDIRLMGALLILLGGAESIFFTWLPYYAGQFFSEGFANALLSVFLAAYVPGRFTYSRLADRMNSLSLVLGTSVAVVVVLVLTLAFSGGYLMVIGIFVAGFLVSGLFPVQLAWGTDQAPEYSGPINAVALTSTQIGFFVFPPLVGILADRYSIEQAMIIPVVLLTVLAVLTAIGRIRVEENPV